MSNSPAVEIENTHDTLKLFYTIILTIALTEGLLKLINTTDGQIRGISSFSIRELLVGMIFLLLMVRFFLGGVRHLDAKYIEESLHEVRGNASKYIGLDIGLLVADAILLLYIGSSVREYGLFLHAVMVLLFIDAVWGGSIAYLYEDITSKERLSPEVIWSMNNFGHAVLFFLVIIFSPGVIWNAPTLLREDILAFLAITNSLIDFRFTWEYYFPF